MKNKHHRIKYGIIILLIIFLYALGAHSPFLQQYITNPAAFKTFILSFGILAPLGLIFLQAIQTTISIFPSQITTILAGYLFGPLLGLLYSIIGAILGSAAVFSLSHAYGKKLAVKLFEKREMVHFNHYFKQKKEWAVFIARVIPIFPNDLVSFTAGLTTISTRNFTLVSTLGFIIQMTILTYFGHSLSERIVNLPLIIVTIFVILFVVIVIFRHHLKRIIIKDLHKVEHVIETEFRKI